MVLFCPDLLYWARLKHFLKQLYFPWNSCKLKRTKAHYEEYRSSINDKWHESCKNKNSSLDSCQKKTWSVWVLQRRWVACKASNAFVTQQMPCRQLGGDCPTRSTHPEHALLYIMQITQVQVRLGLQEASPQANNKNGWHLSASSEDWK